MSAFCKLIREPPIPCAQIQNLLRLGSNHLKQPPKILLANAPNTILRIVASHLRQPLIVIPLIASPAILPAQIVVAVEKFLVALLAIIRQKAPNAIRK